jgi:hypothetical protein
MYRRKSIGKPLKCKGAGRTIPARMNVLWTYWRQFSSKRESLKTLPYGKIPGREGTVDRRILPKVNTTD